MLVEIAGVVLLISLAIYLWLQSGKPKYTKDGNKRIVETAATTPHFFWLAICKSMFFKKSKNIVMPDTCFSQSGIQVDSERVRKYRKLCGFPEGDNEVPLTYPYLMIFPLQGLLLVDPSFPFPAMGLVHLANRIQQFGLLTAGDGSTYTASSRLDPAMQPHPKGYCIVVVSEVHSAAGVLLWRSESTYLYRSKVSASADAGTVYESRIKNEDAENCAEVKPYKLPVGFGLKYAAVSGDFNPIHLYAITGESASDQDCFVAVSDMLGCH